MTHASSARRSAAAIVAALLLTVALIALVAGCSNSSSTGSTTGAPGGAKASYSIAQSALSTMAPDAKLLVVQTAQPVSTTSTPVWAYLFGSPKTDKTYSVYVKDGKAMGAAEFGQAGLTATAWAAVPDVSGWKVDSDEALAKAKETGGMSNPELYAMGFTTFVPEGPKTDTKAFTWYVTLKSGNATSGVTVDAKTGQATKAPGTK